MSARTRSVHFFTFGTYQSMVLGFISAFSAPSSVPGTIRYLVWCARCDFCFFIFVFQEKFSSHIFKNRFVWFFFRLLHLVLCCRRRAAVSISGINITMICLSIRAFQIRHIPLIKFSLVWYCQVDEARCKCMYVLVHLFYYAWSAIVVASALVRTHTHTHAYRGHSVWWRQVLVAVAKAPRIVHNAKYQIECKWKQNGCCASVGL